MNEELRIPGSDVAIARRTRVTEVLGLDYPIIQGPFGGGLSSVALAAAVSNAGGLGSFGAHHLAPSAIADVVARLKDATERPFAVNLWVPLPGEEAVTVSAERMAQHAARLTPYFRELGITPPEVPLTAHALFDEQVEELLESAPPVISFVFGVPHAGIVERARAAGIRLIATATTAEEATALEASGVDVIVASGSDAGGHRGAFLAPVEESLVGTFSLVPQIAAAVTTPVVAAGGIATPNQVRAAHLLGAEGVQVGTSFLVADESIASDAHKNAVTGPAGRHTVLTPAFTGRLARGVANRVTRELADVSNSLPFPILGELMAPLRAAAQQQGRADMGSFWTGQSGQLAERRPAAEVFASLASAYA